MAKVLKSMGERNRRWSLVSENAPVLAEDMPELKESVEELRGLVQEIGAVTAQQTHHMAQARILTARLRALAKRADQIRGRVGASLRGKYGFDSPELIRYGFKPREWVKKDHVDRELELERETRAAEEGTEKKG
jgi:hypothetical protein